MKKIIPALLLLFPLLMHAQHLREEDYNVRSQFTIDLGLSGLQLGYEFVTAPNATFQFRGGIAPLINNTKYYGGNDFEVVPAVMASAEFRAYYNFLQREDQKKNTDNNGANYLGALFTFVSSPLNEKETMYLDDPTSTFIVGPVWGMNRPLGKRAYFHFSIGPGLWLQPERRVTALTVNGDLRFCLKLLK